VRLKTRGRPRQNGYEKWAAEIPCFLNAAPGLYMDVMGEHNLSEIEIYYMTTILHLFEGTDAGEPHEHSQNGNLNFVRAPRPERPRPTDRAGRHSRSPDLGRGLTGSTVGTPDLGVQVSEQREAHV